MKKTWLALLLVFVLAGVCACSNEPGSAGFNNGKESFAIIAGSENKDLRPILDKFAKDNNVELVVKDAGSVDIMMELQKGKASQFDAVWAANSIWISLGDRQKVVKNAVSIMQSPVPFGIKRSVAEGLGWTNNSKVDMKQILSAVTSRKLRFAMTSATQSNSGATAYFGFLSAMAGNPDMLQMKHLDDQKVQDQVKKLLMAVDRSSGSSGYLKDNFVKNIRRYDAMVNYEAMIIAANRELVAAGEEPLYVVYPSDGSAFADFPFGYINHGDAKKEALFTKFQQYLQSDAVQRQILASGRRTGLLNLDPSKADTSVFNPAWGIDVSKIVSSMTMPSEEVIKAAFELYQTVLRKPSFTVYVLDYSGSMHNNGGEKQLKEAMTMLLEPEETKRLMLQPTEKDIQVVIPFSDEVIGVYEAIGNKPGVLRELLDKIYKTEASGGTDMYTALSRGLDVVKEKSGELSGYSTAIILMTDGASQGSINSLKSKLAKLAVKGDIPVYAVPFGNQIDKAQLDEVAKETSGKVITGKDLMESLRNAKSNN